MVNETGSGLSEAAPILTPAGESGSSAVPIPVPVPVPVPVPAGELGSSAVPIPAPAGELGSSAVPIPDLAEELGSSAVPIPDLVGGSEASPVHTQNFTGYPNADTFSAALKSVKTNILDASHTADTADTEQKITGELDKSAMIPSVPMMLLSAPMSLLPTSANSAIASSNSNTEAHLVTLESLLNMRLPMVTNNSITNISNNNTPISSPTLAMGTSNAVVGLGTSVAPVLENGPTNYLLSTPVIHTAASFVESRLSMTPLAPSANFDIVPIFPAQGLVNMPGLVNTPGLLTVGSAGTFSGIFNTGAPVAIASASLPTAAPVSISASNFSSSNTAATTINPMANGTATAALGGGSSTLGWHSNTEAIAFTNSIAVVQGTTNSATSLISNSNTSSVMKEGPVSSVLTGGSHSDILMAGNHNDLLVGSGGADLFVFDGTSVGAHHLIDFVPGSSAVIGDKIVLETSIFAFPRSGGYIHYDPTATNNSVDYNLVQIGTGAMSNMHLLNITSDTDPALFSRTSQDMFIFNQDTGTLYFSSSPGVPLNALTSILQTTVHNTALLPSDIVFIDAISNYKEFSDQGGGFSVNTVGDQTVATGVLTASNVWLNSSHVDTIIGGMHSDFIQANSQGSVIIGNGLNDVFYLGGIKNTASSIQDFHSGQDLLVLHGQWSSDGYFVTGSTGAQGTIHIDTTMNTVVLDNLQTLASLDMTGQALLTVDSTQTGYQSLAQQLSAESYNTNFIFDKGTGNLWYDPSPGFQIKTDFSAPELHLVVTLPSDQTIQESDIAFAAPPPVDPLFHP